MKKLFVIFALLATGIPGYSQLNQPVCGIYYTYDANGQRILREDKCVSNYDNPTHMNPFNGILYPNPTVGPFTVGFNERVAHFRLSVYTIDGTLVGIIEGEQAYEAHYDLSDYVDGSFIVSLWVRRDDESEAMQDFTVIKISDAG